jgi:ketosteroid isomerase-like protein
MPNRDLELTGPQHIEAIRSAFAAALAGDLDAVSRLLAEDVHWRAADGDPSSGCTDRRQALAWMRQAVDRGIRAEVLDVSALDENRVLIRLARRAPEDGGQAAEPHAQIVTFRGNQVAEILVYPSEEAAIRAVEDR